MENRFWKIYSQDVELPEEIRGRVSIVSCLAHSENQQVYLAEDIRKHKFILKSAQGEKTVFLKKDAAMLREHPFSFFPAFVDYIEEETQGYLLREYIKGDTLWELVNNRRPFRVREANEILCRLCDMTGQLHEQKPPIIHRDIKPQNIVLTPERNLFFVDLGTIRTYNKDRNQDTVFVGTKPTAAPEQYGYRQTDARADIYALGVLYLFLLTGSMNVRELGQRERLPKAIRKIILKCTKMDPDDRYQTCGELKKAVERLTLRHAIAGSNRKMTAALPASLVALESLLFCVRVYRLHTKKGRAKAIMLSNHRCRKN